MRYDCTECFRPKCDHKELVCRDCSDKTIRTIRIARHEIASGDIVMRQYLDAGESIQSSYQDEETGEHVLIIRKHIN